MDRLFVGYQRVTAEGRLLTDVMSVAPLARRLKRSRTQLGRKLAQAEAMGRLGWTGARGKSPLWVSADFRQEYLSAQAGKLGIIDAGFAGCAAGDQQPKGDIAAA